MEKVSVKITGAAADKKSEKKAEKTAVGKILFALPFIAIAAIAVHCCVMVAGEIGGYITGAPLTHFDQWYIPVLYAFAYSVPFAVSFAVWRIYTHVKAKRGARAK